MAENGSKIKSGIKSSEVLAGLAAMATIALGGAHEAVGTAAQTIASADPKALIAAASAGGPYAMAGVAVAILLSRTIVKVVDRNAQKHETVASQQTEVARLNAEKSLAELHKVKESQKVKAGNGA